MVKDELYYELMSKKDKRMNIRVSEDYFNRLNQVKKITGVSLSEMIRRGLNLYLDKYKF